MDLQENKHAFSLIIFKDQISTNKNRFLLKYDKRWECYLFPYLRSKDKNDADFIELYAGITTGTECKIIKVCQKTETKYSYSDKCEKTYHHTFYEISFNSMKSNFPKEKEFDAYKWFTPEEMKADKKLMERNKETVDFVLEHFND